MSTLEPIKHRKYVVKSIFLPVLSGKFRRNP